MTVPMLGVTPTRGSGHGGSTRHQSAAQGSAVSDKVLNFISKPMQWKQWKEIILHFLCHLILHRFTPLKNGWLSLHQASGTRSITLNSNANALFTSQSAKWQKPFNHIWKLLISDVCFRSESAIKMLIIRPIWKQIWYQGEARLHLTSLWPNPENSLMGREKINCTKIILTKLLQGGRWITQQPLRR